MTFLSDLEAQLRRLVAQNQFPKAREVLERYRCEVGEAIGALPPGDPEAAGLARHWLGLMAELRVEILAGRSHAAARLARLTQCPARYGIPQRARRTFELLG